MKLCDYKDCTGCEACVNSCAQKAIEMLFDREGFLAPCIDETQCVECGACAKVCPVLHPVDYSSHKLSSYAGWANDKEIRQSGSSGGTFTVLAKYIISNHGVVFGAGFNKDHVLRHIMIDKEKELFKVQGSKYVQSIIGDSLTKIKQLLSTGRLVMFVGTSCQVAGLLNYLRKSYDNLLTVDIVCHGVPAPRFFSKYIQYLRNKYPHFDYFQFRDLKGWSCSSSIYTKKGNMQIKNELFGVDTGYFSFFINGYMNRNCCYNCKYASTPRIGDISLADFWGIGKAKPFKYDLRHGVSLITANTDKGQSYLKAVQDKVFLEERDFTESVKYGNNLQLKQPAHRPHERDSFYDKAYTMDYEQLVTSYSLRLKKKKSIIERLKNKLIYVLYKK